MPTPNLPVSTVAFSCRLPVLWFNLNADYNYHGAFVSFPGKVYQEDPKGVVMAIGDGDIGTQAQPMLFGPGYPGPFYDRSMKRWIPAGPAQTSPDGTTYAVTYHPIGGAGGDFVHIVSVATGKDRVLRATAVTAEGWQVFDFDGRYVYMVASETGKLPTGVWRLDSATSKLVRLANIGSVLMIRAPHVWVGRNNPADPSPPKGSRGPLFDTIVEINMTTGSQTAWIYRPGQAVSLLGVDGSGHPVVSVARGPDFGDATATVLLLARPGDSGTKISGGGVALSHMQADAGRIWFGTDQGIYLWTATGGLRPVFAYQSIWPAGRCT